MKKVEIKKDPENPINTEVLEAAIVEISNAAKKLNSSRLSERAVDLLIYDSLPSGQRYGTGKICGKPAIRAVLNAAEGLADRYLKKQKAKP